MLNRPGRFAVLLGALALLLALPAASASADSPWWQVLSGSRPSHLWIPKDNEQEITTKAAEFFGEPEVVIQGIEVQGKKIGCLGTANFIGQLGCAILLEVPAVSTASEIEALLEATFETSAVEVTGGPVGEAPIKIVVAGRSEPPIILPAAQAVAGESASKVLQAGGSGLLAVTVTNLGDAPADGTSTPITITDEMPEGVVATGVEAFAGYQDRYGPVPCAVEGESQISCTFEKELPSYEGIEVEVFVSLNGEPPASGAPGKVTVSGGNSPTSSAAQPVEVSPSPVSFGIERFSVQAEEEGGGLTSQAGGHPFQLTTTLQFNSGPPLPGGIRQGGRPVEQPAMPRNLRFPLPAGLIGDAVALPKCSMNDFLSRVQARNKCPDQSAIGVASSTFVEPIFLGVARAGIPVFNLTPGVGEPARFGFTINNNPVVVDTAIDPDHGYRITAKVDNTTELAQILSSTVTFWGVPGDSRHNSSRGWSCFSEEVGPCLRPSGLGEPAFLRQPVDCVNALNFQAEAEPWNVSLGSVIADAESAQPHMVGCNQVPFNPSVVTAPTTTEADTSSGLDFQLHMPNIGLLNSKAKAAEGQPKKVAVTLPEGVTVNPSQANGLGACSPADYARETVDSAPGAGCPESAKVGTVDISTPLLEEEAHGSVYVAKPYKNPFGSLLALYMVAKVPQRGVLVKQAGKVELNPATGQLVTTFDDLPQIPFEDFKLHFFGGDRAPLVMPSSCGEFQITASFTPWNAADPNSPQPDEVVTKTTPLTIDHGPNGGSCPSGTPPFKPGFTAGTENNAADTYSPFKVRLTRNDGEQEFSRFSLKLPKGVIGNLSGIPFCSEAAIAQARSRTGANGGQEELDRPSCPAASQIGHTLVGAGVGPSLTYVPGNLYLAGPYQGAKLSAVAITPAKVGPFDLGNVVIRQALKVDPVTAEVSTDGSSSGPIPHILQGIVVHARDIRVLVDRKDFVLNPTNCERMTASASVSGLVAVDVSSPFQAADCASLGFKPKLALSLKGGTKRTGHPRLKAVLTARKGDANIREAVVALPHSEFLEQSHIRTICTRVQFNAGGGNGEQCPKGSIYGRVKAVTPLLDEPLSGPVYLRSSNHPLPDLVAALHSGKVDIDLAGRIDSVNGGIRNSFEAVPDAPVTKFTLEMQGGKKGLLVNSTNICRGKHRASATFTGQNGKRLESRPLLKAKCGGKKKH